MDSSSERFHAVSVCCLLPGRQASHVTLFSSVIEHCDQEQHVEEITLPSHSFRELRAAVAGKAWPQAMGSRHVGRNEKPRDHISSHKHKTANWKRDKAKTSQSPPPVMSFSCKDVAPPQPKQHWHLEAKCSTTRACRGHFSFKALHHR